MPKNKTHSGAKKKFRLTGTGKVVRSRKPSRRHFHEQVSTRKKRRQGNTVEVSAADRPRVRKMLGK